MYGCVYKRSVWGLCVEECVIVCVGVGFRVCKCGVEGVSVGECV